MRPKRGRSAFGPAMVWMARAGAVALVFAAVAGRALGSNMMFKTEQQFDYAAGSLNRYYVSFPFMRSFPDVWTTGIGMNPLSTDGFFSDDVLADWYSGGDGVCDPGECTGAISLLRFDRTLDVWRGQTIYKDPLNVVRVIGPRLDVDTDPGEGFQVMVYAGRAQYPIEIVGSENPFIMDWPLTAVPNNLNYYPFSLPYNTLWRTSQELLEAAWAARENPTTECFELVIAKFDNATNQHVEQTVRSNLPCPACLPSCQPEYPGTVFDLLPPWGYRLQINQGSVFLPLPHY